LGVKNPGVEGKIVQRLRALFSLFNPEFALGIPEIMGGGVKRVKK
jgi:hypothetical protein